MGNRRLRDGRNSLAGAVLGWFRVMSNDEEGVTALEYAFIAGLVAIAVVAAVTTLGTGVSGLFTSVISGF
jgi:pilus assembly protein Flp/PilA